MIKLLYSCSTLEHTNHDMWIWVKNFHLRINFWTHTSWNYSSPTPKSFFQLALLFSLVSLSPSQVSALLYAFLFIFTVILFTKLPKPKLLGDWLSRSQRKWYGAARKKLLLKPKCVYVCVFCFTPRHSYGSLWQNISPALPALVLLVFFAADDSLCSQCVSPSLQWPLGSVLQNTVWVFKSDEWKSV